MAKSIIAGLVAIAACAVNAQVPPAPAAFPNQACTPGTLYYRQVDLGRIGHIAYHNGRIYTNDVSGVGRREWRFADTGDPTSMTLVTDVGLMQFRTQQGGHALVKVGDYAGDFLRRSAPGVNVLNDEMPFADIYFPGQAWPQGGELHYLYYPWAMPFNWIQYGPSEGDARLWRADQLLSEFAPLVEHGVAGNSILFGNLLIVASDASMQGVVIYDIGPTFASPAQPPRVLDKLTGAVGGYLAAIWENYLVLSGGADRDKTFVIDFSDPTALRLVHTFDLAGDPALNAGSNVPYVETQDRFVFTRRHKLDMEALAPVLELDEAGNNRPAGSASGAIDVSQYTLPIGNLLLTGGIGEAGRDGLGVWCHDAVPDTTPPYVGYHVPRPDQTDYPLGAPISLFIAETLESFTIVNGVTVIVRPVGGEPIDAWVSFAHDGILTVTPREFLRPDTTYEVILPEGGIRDAADNGIAAYAFAFSTGSVTTGANGAPQIDAFTASREAGPGAIEPGDPIQLSVVATDPDGDDLEYRFSFGDGTSATDWLAAGAVGHTFSTAGHFEVKVQVRDVRAGGAAVTAATRTVNVAPVIVGPYPTHSSQLALDAVQRRIWAVNPDNDGVAIIDADAATRLAEIDLRGLLGIDASIDPISVALDAQGDAWVACRDADLLLELASDGTLLRSIELGYGSAPQAVATTADGRSIVVSLGARGATDPGNGQLVRFDAMNGVEAGRIELGPTANAIAITADGSRAYVSRLISTEHFGQIWVIDLDAMSLVQTLPLWRDRGLGGLDVGGADGPGVPNYVTSLVLSPQQDWLWYTAVKDDTNRGLFFRQDGDFNTRQTHDSTVRAVLGRIDLLGSGGPREPGREGEGSQRARVDVDNADSPAAIAFAPRGDYVFAALQGNDAIAVFDDLAVRAGNGRTSLWRIEVGAAPQAMVWDEMNQALWVKAFLARSVARLDLRAFLDGGRREVDRIDVATTAGERLAADVLAGKRQFYFAGNATTGQNAMSFEGYISCASCHLDGGQDGRVWDFTQRGEGMRNTISLRGRRGTGHGNVHWTANFDEIADFELDIVNEFNGLGLLGGMDQPHPPLGQPNAGRSAALDQLAAYVASLDAATLPRSPWRDFDGSAGASFDAGRQLFQEQGCMVCHRPATDYTDSTLGDATLHDVGTLRGASGQRLGAPLAGIDTPTLLSVWTSDPYLHDGSARLLADVFAATGGVELQAEDGQLAGGAALAMFPEFLEDSAFHGHMVNLPQTGAAVTWSGVDGGAGGSAQIEVRYLPRSAGTLTLRINGSAAGTHAFQAQTTHFEWVHHRFAAELIAGASNTIEVVLTVAGLDGAGLDEITVANSAVLVRANPHRRAMALSADEFTQLRAFLLQLDGLDAMAPGPAALFVDGFEAP